MSSICARHLVRSNGSLTGGDEDESGSSIDNTSSGREDGGGSTVADGLVDTPEFAGGESPCTGTVQFRVSMQILELEISDHTCLHERECSSELSRVGATERQLAVLD